jgi:WD40 repeat-containing protein SMU1
LVHYYYYSLQGQLPPRSAAGKYDVFSGAAKVKRRDDEEKPPTKLANTIKFGKDSRPESSRFSPDGQSITSGGTDGFIEVWDPDTCRLRKDLAYQVYITHFEGNPCTHYSRL